MFTTCVGPAARPSVNKKKWDVQVSKKKKNPTKYGIFELLLFFALFQVIGSCLKKHC